MKKKYNPILRLQLIHAVHEFQLLPLILLFSLWALSFQSSNIVKDYRLIALISFIIFAIIILVLFSSILEHYTNQLFFKKIEKINVSDINHPEKGYMPDKAFMVVYNFLYSKELFSLAAEILSRISHKHQSNKLNVDIPLNQLMFLFKNYNLNLKKYKISNPQKLKMFETQMIRYIENQINPERFKDRLPDYLFTTMNQKISTDTFSKDQILDMLLPLKLKDIPPELFNNDTIDLNYLTYLLLIPNRKSMTIDGLRKVINFYPKISTNLELINYFSNKELSLPYSEKKIIQLMKLGISGEDLYQIAYIQMKNIQVTYPERPKFLSNITRYLKENSPEIRSLFESEESVSLDFDPYAIIPSLNNFKNLEYKGYTFHVMENQDQLTDLGMSLHLCVAGYPSRGLMNQFQIISVKKENQHVYCVSICIKTKKIDQMKKKFDLPVLEWDLRNFINKTISS